MKIKSFIFAFFTLVLVLGFQNPVSAQSVNSCASFNYNLGVGMRGGDVARLQAILISEGHLGNGLGTGYYGSLTFQAVKRFQTINGISSTGFVGPLTRAVLSQRSCNNPVPPTNTNQAPTISSVSPAYGAFGGTVTIYGTNFNRAQGNSINFANVQNIRTGVVSQNGTSIQFTIPASPCPQGNYVCTMQALAPGTYGLSINNGFGTSNTVNFQVTDPYNPNPNPNPNPTGQTPTITSISPASGPYGTNVTIYGTNFNRNSGNSISFANAQNVKTGVYSSDGTSLQFTIPATPCSEGYMCPQVVLNPGYYPISIHNGVGSSNQYSFQVTNDSNNPGGPNPNPVINSVEGPTTLAVGQQGTWTVRGSNSGGGNLTYTVTWGDEVNYSGASVVNDTYLQSTTFTHAYQSAGTYTPRFTVRNTMGREVTSTITVQVAGNTTQNAPTLVSLSPTTGRFGNPITITGTNFHRYNNNINFGSIARAAISVPSLDGKTIQYTPTGSTCAADAYYCTMQALGDGSYPITVTTPLGTTNALTFVVATNASSTSQDQTLKINETATVGSVQVTPLGVPEDSRCPTNVTCVQAGRVVAATEIRSMYGFTTVNLSSIYNQPYITDDGYKVQLIAVTPARTSTSTIPVSDYRFTYKIWR